MSVCTQTFHSSLSQTHVLSFEVPATGSGSCMAELRRGGLDDCSCRVKRPLLSFKSGIRIDYVSARLPQPQIP